MLAPQGQLALPQPLGPEHERRASGDEVVGVVTTPPAKETVNVVCGMDTVASESIPVAAPPAREPSPISGTFRQINVIERTLQSLKKDGIDLALDFVGNVAANPVGGIHQASAESHWVMAAADIDLDALASLPNTKLHLQGAWFTGDSLGREAIGNSISFQQTWRPVSGPRLTQFNVEHDSGVLNLVVGRGAVNSYFNNSPFNCVFMSNTSCLTAYGGISNIGITAYPNSSWFAKARIALTDRWYVQAGAFEYNNNLNLKGKGGLDFSLGKGTGALIPGEIGYQTTFANDRYPRRYKLGFYYNSDGGQNVYADRNGQSAVLTGLPFVQNRGGRLGLYLMFDQTVTRASGNSKRNLALFGRVFANAGNTAQLGWFASVGFVKTGTLKAREADTIGFLISNTHFSNDQIASLRDRRAKAGGTGSPSSNEIVGEINYGYAAVPGVRIMPNLQYVINPDPIYAPARKTDIPHAIVFGVRIVVKLVQLFGS
jgi:porin